MEKYDHIPIEREKPTPRYKGHSNPTAPRPPYRENPAQHGQKLFEELEQATESIVSTRKGAGIQTDSLMVLEVSSSDALAGDLLELLIGRFNLSLVEETPEEVNRSKLVVQFEDRSSIEKFNRERALWASGSEDEGVLTFAKRRDLFSCIESIRCLTREDRIGKRLKAFVENKTVIKDFFVVDIDVWYNNDRTKIPGIENDIKTVLGTTGSRLLGDLFEISGLLLGRALVNEFSLNALLDMDIICSVELPFQKVSSEPSVQYAGSYTPVINDTLGDNAPLATVLDSGIFTGNPLLRTSVLAEEDFDTTEQSATDFDGHGTAVAGIVVYGTLHEFSTTRVFTPQVRVCNGKIMHHDKNTNSPCFRNDVRPEQLVKEAILHFYKEYGCRIFNLSAGNIDDIYSGGRQFAWASMLDELSRDLDIVIIVSAGNVSNPVINEFASREDLLSKVRNQLFSPEHALIDPATTALGITVGSITRFSEPESVRNQVNRISVGKTNYPSAFTRIGKGVNKGIKPDFVDYGGNFALRQIVRGDSGWFRMDRNLAEPSLSCVTDKIFSGFYGTSFSAPHVTHMAARLERALEQQLKQRPSANLIRAMLANSASCTDEMIKWGESSEDSQYKGHDNPKHERFMRLYGYGKVSEKLLASTDNTVTLFAEDVLSLRSFHLYQIPVPKRFLRVKADKSITVSLAYNPETRIGRKEYLATNLRMEIFRKIDEDTLIKYKAKRETGTDTEDDFKCIPDTYKAMGFVPGYDALQKSTLQQRRWCKTSRGGSDLSWDVDEPYIFVLVSGKERYKFADQEQPYALCITFSYESEENIDLYNQLRNHVRVKVSEQVQERIRVQGG